MNLEYLNPHTLSALAAASTLMIVVGVILLFREVRTEQLRKRYKELVRLFSGEFAQRLRVEDVARDFLGLALRIVMPEADRKRVELRLSMAGYTGAEPLHRFQLARLIGLLGSVIIGVIGTITGIMAWSFAVVMVILVFLAPDIWLARQIAARTKRIGFQLPEALDLLQLCVRAGLGFSSGLQEVARVQKGAVSAEFSRVLQEMQFGTSRLEAFQALADRTKQPDLIRFAHALVRADQAGITLSDMLQEQARSMRESRHTLAREKAQQISVKILFPLMICFLPGVFLIVLGPAILNAMTTLGS